MAKIEVGDVETLKQALNVALRQFDVFGEAAYSKAVERLEGFAESLDKSRPYGPDDEHVLLKGENMDLNKWMQPQITKQSEEVEKFLEKFLVDSFGSVEAGVEYLQYFELVYSDMEFSVDFNRYFIRQVIRIVPRMVVCPNCQREVEAYWEVCWRCHKPMTESSTSNE